MRIARFVDACFMHRLSPILRTFSVSFVIGTSSRHKKSVQYVAEEQKRISHTGPISVALASWNLNRKTVLLYYSLFLRSFHSNKERPWTCQECGLPFAFRDTLTYVSFVSPRNAGSHVSRACKFITNVTVN